MKTLVCVLAVAALMPAVAGPAFAETPKSETPKPVLTGPYVHENLAVYLILGEDRVAGLPILTLEEALKRGFVEVQETGDVNELKIRNKSEDHYVYVLPGDIIKGGKQDRTLPNGFLMTRNSGFVPVDSFCVEQGRWSQRGAEAAGYFSGSTKMLADRELKLAAKESKSQGEVWKNVAAAQEKLSRNVGADVKAPVSASSLQLSLENAGLEKAVAAYTGAIGGAAEGDLPGAVGMAFAINGEFNSADSFASRELFLKLWPKLLEAAATEAVGEKQPDKKFSDPDPGAIADSLDETKPGTPEGENVAGENRIVRWQRETSYAFETFGKADDSEFRIHYNVLSRTPGDAVKKPVPVTRQANSEPKEQDEQEGKSPDANGTEAEKKGLLESIGSIFKRNRR